MPRAKKTDSAAAAKASPATPVKKTAVAKTARPAKKAASTTDQAEPVERDDASEDNVGASASDADTDVEMDGAGDERESAPAVDGTDRAEGADGDDPDEGEFADGDAEELEGVDLPPKVAKRATSTEDNERAITSFDPMAAYLREVQRHPLLSPEETHDIAVKFVKTQDPAAAARLVTSNLRLVVKIAYEYRRAYKNILDLVQEGNIGLMQAVKRYDPYRGVRLSSYAAWWIRAYILRFILNNWRLVKLGTTQAQRKLFFNLRKKRAELAALGIDPTDAEIAKQLKVPESDVAEMDVRLSASERSLDAPVGDSEGRSVSRIDMMPSGGSGPETMMADEELQSLLKDKLADFRSTLVASGKEKDLAIFDERLVADDPLTLQELGDRFGISRERVRQLEQRLTGKLREYLEEQMGDAAHVR